MLSIKEFLAATPEVLAKLQGALEATTYSELMELMAEMPPWRGWP